MCVCAQGFTQPCLILGLNCSNEILKIPNKRGKKKKKRERERERGRGMRGSLSRSIAAPDAAMPSVHHPSPRPNASSSFFSRFC